jgi:hypothetical protein
MPVPPPPPPPAATDAPVYVAPPVRAPVVVPGRRTAFAAAAGVALVVMGVLGGIAALALFTVGKSVIDSFDLSNLPGLENVNDPNALVSGVVSFAAILLLVFSAFYIIGGVGAIRGAGWGRVIGIIIGILGTLFWLPAIAGSNQVGAGESPIFTYVFLALHIFVFATLAFFWREKASLA